MVGGRWVVVVASRILVKSQKLSQISQSYLDRDDAPQAFILLYLHWSVDSVGHGPQHNNKTLHVFNCLVSA